MKENSWEDCIDSCSSINISQDRAKAKSLRETAKERVEYLKEATVKDTNANYIFESYYTSILELLHAILITNRFKVKNHICLGFYLRDILKKDELYRLFDDLRYKRNSLTYYGMRMDFVTAKNAIGKSEKLFKKLNSLYAEESARA